MDWIIWVLAGLAVLIVVAIAVLTPRNDMF